MDAFSLSSGVAGACVTWFFGVLFDMDAFSLSSGMMTTFFLNAERSPRIVSILFC